MITMKVGEVYREYNPVLDKTSEYEIDNLDYDEDGEIEFYTKKLINEYPGLVE